ncbi:hypothetical protein O181_017370 [Austropuccinia psidii MF-1]|uniref:Uncharacterized protein n=1 Tax=Austropuccinia psidii MF-1 TaxID=1389203 RepID=A0A9Q3GSY4_9BASI|nr:hypothetical protein [Austropuccinia psidii MF-1]
MPVQHSPPALQPRSQSRAQSVPILTSREPLNGTTMFPQLRTHLDIIPIMEGKASFRKEGKGPSRSIFLTGFVGTFPGISKTSFKVLGEDAVSEVTGGPTLSQSNYPVSNQSHLSSFTFIKNMTQIMAKLQAPSRLHL